MGLVQDTISGFIGGISQQPNKLMFPNQAKQLLNMSLNVISGLSRRKPTEHVKRLMAPLSVYPKLHTVNKEDEQYLIALTGTGIKVFDLKGNEKTVNFDGGEKNLENLLKYITTQDPLRDLALTTIGDYTFILNKKVVAKLTDDKYPNPHGEAALIFVKQGDYAIDYTININGTDVATKTTSDTSKADLKTNGITQALYDAIVKKLGTTEWSFSKLNSTILIQRKDGTPFTIRTSDSNADRSLFCFYKETENFTDLPAIAPDGFILKITGENGDTSDDYYVKFTTTDNSTFGIGVWKECCAPGIQYHIDPSSMPHALIREADGTFTFKQIKWTDRHAGDEDTAKTPSVFGNTIQEVFTHKGRLALLAGDKSIYSDTEDIFSFFKRTVMTKLDTDPIDVASNSKMVSLKHSLPFNKDLLLFSPSSIFTISGGDVFSNSTVAIDLTIEYPCSPLAKPISIGETAVFVYENGDYSGVYEIYTASTYSTAARNITEQVPMFLPKGIFKITGSTSNNIMGLLSYKERNSIYIYNYYYTSEAKAQSAWHKWTSDGIILDAEFIDNYLHLVVQYDDGIYYEKINITSEQFDDDLDFLIHLDRKIKLDNGTFDEEHQTTVFELPYKILDGESFMAVDENGFPIPALEFLTSDEASVVKVEGNHTAAYFGFVYKSLWELSNIYKRQTTQTGASKVIEGTLILGDIDFTYLNSCGFSVIITPAFTSQSPSTHKFTGIITGTSSAVLGKITPHSDTFLVPVMADNEDVKIEVISDGYLPCSFTALTWIGEFNVRGQ